MSLWYAQKKDVCVCVIQFVQISIFKLDIFCFVYTLLLKTNKSLIPWNKLTFPLPTANEKKSSEENKTESVREIYSTFLFSEASCSLLSRFLSFSLFMKTLFCHCLRHTQWIGEKEGNLLPIFIFMLHKNSFLLLSLPFHFRFSAFVSLFSCSFSFLTF